MNVHNNTLRRLNQGRCKSCSCNLKLFRTKKLNKKDPPKTYTNISKNLYLKSITKVIL